MDAVTMQVSAIIHDVTGIEVPSAETALQELGIDSVAMLEILVVAEQRFSITLNENLVREFRTVRAISRIVTELAGLK